MRQTLPFILFAFTAVTVGCDADFVDLRPENVRAGGSTNSPMVDDSGVPMETTDDDSGSSVPDPTTQTGSRTLSPGTVVSSGQVVGVGSYTASGTASLVRTEGGTLELQFDDAFMSSNVPGPVAALSTRDVLEDGITPGEGDVLAGIFETPIRGPVAYVVGDEAEGAGFAWVYCNPFQVEVARAELTPAASAAGNGP